jgi:hypothetical protein
LWGQETGGEDKSVTSGASKRKRKAELEWKNLELSASLLKFLKRNDDASVNNKDFGENESGEPVEDLAWIGWVSSGEAVSKPLKLQ